MPGPGEAMRHLVRGIGDGIIHTGIERDGGNRLIAGGHALRHGDDIRFDPVSVRPKPLPGASEAANHLIRPQKDIIFLADRVDPRPISCRRGNHAARPHYRFRDKGGHLVRSQRQDFFLQRIGGQLGKILFRQIASFLEPVDSGRNMMNPGIGRSNCGCMEWIPERLAAAVVTP